jgi:hypothetical protein
MKKLLMIAVVTFASASAFATKARLNALSYPMSRQLTDVQTVFINPSDLTLMGSWVTFETGATDTGIVPVTTPSPEAGFARAVGDARWGFYLGHTGTGITADTFARGASSLRPATLLMEENPINLFYATKMADMSWGLGLNYSNTDRKTAGKQTATGVTAGVRMGFWDASLDLDITDTAELGTLSWTGKTGADLRAGYVMDTMYFYGQYAMSGGKGTVAGTDTTDKENSQVALGVVNTTKSEGGEFFYGAALAMMTTNDKVATGSKSEILALPVVIGIEADAASWLVLRGSITQTVLLNSLKTTPTNGTSTDTTGANNTRVAAGTGIKFNKFMLDTTLAAESTGLINGTSLLAQAGLTYNF